jgi:hypothetical protein
MLILFNSSSNVQVPLPMVITETRDAGADKAVSRNGIFNNPCTDNRLSIRSEKY